jgi:hypothetical protein
MSRQVIAALAVMVPVMVAPAVLVWLEISGIFNKIKKPWSLLLLRGWQLPAHRSS